MRAAIISFLLNLGLALSAVYPGSQGSPSLLARIADIIAAPPGAIAKLAFSPQQHTADAIIVAAAESLACSFLFYLLIAWVILKGANGIRRARMVRSERRD